MKRDEDAPEAPVKSGLERPELRDDHGRDSWRGHDMELAREEGMLDIATDRPVLPGFRSRSARADAVISVFGLVALASPLALWIAWTQELLLWALGAGLVSVLICWLTVHFADSD